MKADWGNSVDTPPELFEEVWVVCENLPTPIPACWDGEGWIDLRRIEGIMFSSLKCKVIKWEYYQ